MSELLDEMIKQDKERQEAMKALVVQKLMKVHRIDERTAASLMMTVHSVVDFTSKM